MCNCSIIIICWLSPLTTKFWYRNCTSLESSLDCLGRIDEAMVGHSWFVCLSVSLSVWRPGVGPLDDLHLIRAEIHKNMAIYG